MRLAAACSDNMLRTYDARTLALRQEFRTHDAPLSVVAWHPSGKVVLTAAEDLVIRFWDLERRQFIGEIIGPPSAAHGLAVSPAGTRLIGVFGDKSVRVWEIGSLLKQAGL